MQTDTADHGGGVDAAAAHWGGARSDWIDLSTGINPLPYPVPPLPPQAWAALPDQAAQAALVAAARAFWKVPDGAAVLAAPGASVLIAQLPFVAPKGRVRLHLPTYNEHARAFAAAGWQQAEAGSAAEANVIVHPNNPDGRLQDLPDPTAAPFCIVDESFCDVTPAASHMPHAGRAGVVILKSFGKFWGLAGLRLGFAIGDPTSVGRLAQGLGPWPVSGAALAIGAQALRDTDWAKATRTRLARDAARLDTMITAKGAEIVGGTTLFRLYRVEDAAQWQDHFARHQIWTRIFPYSRHWLRLGLAGSDAHWARLQQAVAAL